MFVDMFFLKNSNNDKNIFIIKLINAIGSAKTTIISTLNGCHPCIMTCFEKHIIASLLLNFDLPQVAYRANKAIVALPLTVLMQTGHLPVLGLLPSICSYYLIAVRELE